jgi:hypothetical protein
MRTFTPDLDPAVLERLRHYAAHFARDFPQSKPARWAGVYLHGLLADGERKSIEPLSRRVTLPPDLTSKDPEQALQQFVNQSPWDERAVLARYRALMAGHFASPEGVFVVDDTSFPKRGCHSVGVSHQYRGALGKRANCQVAVTLHYTGPRGHFPLAVRLHLPESWTGDAERMDAAGVPDEARAPRAKGQIALELLDRVRGEGDRGWRGGRRCRVRQLRRVPRRADGARVELRGRRATRDHGLRGATTLGAPRPGPARRVAAALGADGGLAPTCPGR